MGLFGSLFGRKKKAEKRPSPLPQKVATAAPSRQEPQPGSAKHGHGTRSQWIGAGTPVKIHGFTIPGGMIYVGTDLRSSTGASDPALINPSLEIRKGRVVVDGSSIGYWPSYAEITPEVRTGYLAWLADGRRNLDAPIGLVFLFMYGLERRVLLDIASDQSLAPELIQIRREMDELLGMYGTSSRSFAGYAAKFIDFIDGLSTHFSRVASAVSAPDIDRFLTPFALRYTLGEFAASGNAIPAELAYLWAWHHPENALRSPARRCPADLVRLFTLRFNERYPVGLATKPGKTRLKLSYQPASAGLRETTITFSDTPDVFQQAVPSGRVIDLFQQTQRELDPYSRWIGKNPTDRGTLPAIALLPRELIPGASRSVSALYTWIDSTLGDRESVTTSARDLIGHWPAVPPGKLSRSDSVSLVHLLGALDIGIEPDPRFGGPALSDERPVVLFRTDRSTPSQQSPSYSAASMLIHLAVATASADGDFSDAEFGVLQAHLGTSLGLTSEERTRLRAHTVWLASGDIKLTGLKKRLEILEVKAREEIGKVLVTIASIDGVVTPGEVTMLTKIYRLLSLNPDHVTHHLHGILTQSRPIPAREPIIVRPGSAVDSGFQIPKRPGVPPTVTTPCSASVALDAEAIRSKLAQSAEISSLLAEIFADPDEVEASKAESSASTQTSDGEIPGLDQRHSTLFIQIADRSEWSAIDFAELCAQLDLMPAGAIDTLNEVAYEISGEPLLEGEGTITVNTYALDEIRSQLITVGSDQQRA